MLDQYLSSQYEIETPFNPTSPIHRAGGLPKTVWEGILNRTEQLDSDNNLTNYAGMVLSGVVTDFGYKHREYLTESDWGHMLEIYPDLSDLRVYGLLEKAFACPMDTLINEYVQRRLPSVSFNPASKTWETSVLEAFEYPVTKQEITKINPVNYNYETGEVAGTETHFSSHHEPGMSGVQRQQLLNAFLLTEDDIPDFNIYTPLAVLVEAFKGKLKQLPSTELKTLLGVNEVINAKVVYIPDYNGLRKAPILRAKDKFVSYLVNAFSGHFGYNPFVYTYEMENGHSYYATSLPLTENNRFNRYPEMAGSSAVWNFFNCEYQGEYNNEEQLPQVRVPIIV
jgi:hypothetical protein